MLFKIGFVGSACNSLGFWSGKRSDSRKLRKSGNRNVQVSLSFRKHVILARTELDNRGDGLLETQLIKKSNGVVKGNPIEKITRRNLIIAGIGTLVVSVLALVPFDSQNNSFRSSTALNPLPPLTPLELRIRVYQVADGMRIISDDLERADLSLAQACSAATRLAENYSILAVLAAILTDLGSSVDASKVAELQALQRDEAEIVAQLSGEYFSRRNLDDAFSPTSMAVRKEQIRVISAALLASASKLETFLAKLPSKSLTQEARQFVDKEKSQS
mmetsp:Transcript_3357/g.5875  ORF Transcript_3357/g.5875 Transcript_3357/m.5875 type:complete len:274 (-) Transcript_3357:1810-2631(-)